MFEWFWTIFSLGAPVLSRPLHDYDQKPPNLTFYGEREHTTTNFPSSFWTWIKSLRIQLHEKSPAFDILGPFMRGKIRRVSHKTRTVPFIRAVLVLDKTCSYKWYNSRLIKTRLIFPLINGPNMSNAGDFSWGWILKDFIQVQTDEGKFVVVFPRPP